MNRNLMLTAALGALALSLPAAAQHATYCDGRIVADYYARWGEQFGKSQMIYGVTFKNGTKTPWRVDYYTRPPATRPALTIHAGRYVMVQAGATQDVQLASQMLANANSAGKLTAAQIASATTVDCALGR